MDFDAVRDRRGTASYKWERYGPDALPFWVADMDLPSPPAVVAALEARAAHGIYGYSLLPPSLVAAVRGHLLDRYGWDVAGEWLVYLPGVVPALNLACRAFAAEGEEVLTIVPAYPPFLEAPGLQGRRLVTAVAGRGNGRWELPLAALEAAVTPKTRVLLFCHPHNPLGRVWSAAEVAAVVDLCRRRDLVLVSDEIHCDLALDIGRHVPAATAAPDAPALTVTLMSPSKTFNLPGLNFAFAVIPDGELRRRFTAAGAGLLPFAGCFAIVAAEAAYREGGAWLAELRAYLRGNADRVAEFVAGLDGVTTTRVEATYLAWLDARERLAARGGDADLARVCLKAGIALSGGGAFGAAPGFARLNFGCPRSLLDEGLARLKAALGSPPCRPPPAPRDPRARPGDDELAEPARRSRRAYRVGGSARHHAGLPGARLGGAGPGCPLAGPARHRAQALAGAGGVAQVAAIGISNQRETTVVWERASGAPVAPAVVWQDRRTAAVCRALAEAGAEPLVRARTGLVLDPYFTATKLRWILEHIPDGPARACRGELAGGTVDSWLVWNLTGGRLHVTDATNASRTLLYDIRRGVWDDELLELFGVPRELLPAVVDTSGIIGETEPALFGRALPIAALCGDQQASLYGHGCQEAGRAKVTYGTGCFLLAHTGAAPVDSTNGLLATVALQRDGVRTYALEGSAFVGGAAVGWLRDALGVVASPAEASELAARLGAGEGAVFVPALAGLGAPHWDPAARGAFFDLHLGTTGAHMARAVLEGVALQVSDLVAAAVADAGFSPEVLHVDGGASVSDPLLQFQADVLGLPVVRAAEPESTALGAAFLAGLACGFWRDPAALEELRRPGRRFAPDPAVDRIALLARWRKAVVAVRQFAAG